MRSILRHARRQLPNFTGPNVLCAVLLTVLIAMVASCTLDREKLERTRTDLEILCTQPLTQALKDWCGAWAPGVLVPTPLKPSPTKNGPAE